MTGAGAAAALVARGLSPEDAAGRGSLFDVVLRACDRAAVRPGCLLWVPGRLEVFGKHTDYGGGRTVVCAVPRGFAVAVSPRADGAVHVVDAARDARLTLRQDAAAVCAADSWTAHPDASTGWRRYVQTVVRRLSRNFPGMPLGADIVLASDLPRASGMSSSSALMVSVAAALGRAGEIRSRPEWQANIGGGLDAAAYYACIENGMDFRGLGGDAGVGTHGGSEDHAAIVTGRPGHLSAFSFVPMRRLADAPVPTGWQFVVSPCGVAADKTGSALGPYNALAASLRALLDLWNSGEAEAPSLAAALGAAPDAGDRLRAMVRRSHLPEWPRDLLERRLDHFIREDARAAAALAAFVNGDTAAVGELAALSQEEASTLLGNQVPETVALAASARPLGAFAASSFGAGFGGSVWALVEREAASRFASRWHRDAFLAAPGPPLLELDVD